MSPSSQKKDRVLNWKYLGLNSVCTQTNKLETDANTLYYSLLKLKSSPSAYSKHKKESNKYIYIFKQQPQKSHEQDILPKNLQIDRSFFASYGMHALNYFVSLGIFMRQGRRTQRQQNHWLSSDNSSYSGPKRDHHCQEDPSTRDKPNKNLLHLVVHWVITAIKADNFVWCKALPAATQI